MLCLQKGTPFVRGSCCGTAIRKKDPDIVTSPRTAVSLLACLWAGAAFTDELPQPNISLDVRGFTIGMTAEEALDYISSEFPDLRAQVREEYDGQTGSYFARQN